jgi:hypothetical protein
MSGPVLGVAMRRYSAYHDTNLLSRPAYIGDHRSSTALTYRIQAAGAGPTTRAFLLILSFSFFFFSFFFSSIFSSLPLLMDEILFRSRHGGTRRRHRRVPAAADTRVPCNATTFWPNYGKKFVETIEIYRQNTAKHVGTQYLMKS